VLDKLTPYVFESDSVAAARAMSKMFFVLAVIFIAVDLYAFFRHGHILGAIFVAILFGLVALALFSLKGIVTISNEIYRSEYRVFGLPFIQETPIKGWQILHVTYSNAHAVGVYSTQSHIQFFLAARDDRQPREGLDLFSNLSFELNEDPVKVAVTIKKLKDATGFKLTFGEGPMRDIYPTYKKLYGELND